MATETKSTSPATTEKENKEETPVADNGQAKEAAIVDANAGEKADEAKPEPTPPKPNVHKTNFDKDVVYLYQFSRTPLLPSVSPYCIKVETWLRLAGIKYENVDHKMKFRSHKGQLPFVELNGEEIADSAIIIKDLSQKFSKDMDEGLTADQRTISHAMISMIENHLSWVILYFRSKNPDTILKGYKLNLQSALGTRMPNVILNFFFKLAYGRKGAKKVKAQGIGVHTEEEIIEFAQKDLQTLSDFLGDKEFFFGAKPTNLDVVAFGVLAQLRFMEKEVAHPVRDRLDQFPKLIALVDRIKTLAYPDWDDMCANLDLNSHLPKPPKETKDAKETKEEKPAEEPEKDKGEEKEKDTEKEAKEKAEKETEK